MLDAATAREQARAKYESIRQEYGLYALGSRTHRNMRLVFARGRRCDLDKLPTRPSDFSYPPADRCTRFGRAHIPHYPVFYAGESPEVIADELRLESQASMCIAIFYTPAPVDFKCLLLLHDELDPSNCWAPARDGLRQHLDGQKNLREPTSRVWDRVQRAAHLFREDNREDKYEITGSIAHHCIYEQDLDAILYPSVRNDQWCNFAINRRFVGASLQLHCVLACRWTGLDLVLYHTGVPSPVGSLEWRKANRKDHQALESGYRHLSDG